MGGAGRELDHGLEIFDHRCGRGAWRTVVTQERRLHRRATIDRPAQDLPVLAPDARAIVRDVELDRVLHADDARGSERAAPRALLVLEDPARHGPVGPERACLVAAHDDLHGSLDALHSSHVAGVIVDAAGDVSVTLDGAERGVPAPNRAGVARDVDLESRSCVVHAGRAHEAVLGAREEEIPGSMDLHDRSFDRELADGCALVSRAEHSSAHDPTRVLAHQ